SIPDFSFYPEALHIPIHWPDYFLAADLSLPYKFRNHLDVTGYRTVYRPYRPVGSSASHLVFLRHGWAGNGEIQAFFHFERTRRTPVFCLPVFHPSKPVIAILHRFWRASPYRLHHKK